MLPSVRGCRRADAGFAAMNGQKLTFTEGDSSMRTLGQLAVNFLKNEDGPTAVEYAVMLALIIVVCIAAISALGSNASNTFTYVGTKISTTSS
jgi:pilus assembly protein Flp/PilA